MRGVTRMEDLPSPHFAEIAFAGRSNVGKSSLLNALTGKKDLARSSSTPGRTQELNFFNVSDKFLLVDLPGYGYAKAPEQKVRNWQTLIRDYIAGRAVLRRICVLIDARHGLKDNDHEFLGFLDTVAVSALVILTKIDKIKDSAVETVQAETLAGIKKHPCAYPQVIATSAEKNTGLDALRALLTA